MKSFVIVIEAVQQVFSLRFERDAHAHNDDARCITGTNEDGRGRIKKRNCTRARSIAPGLKQ